TLNRASILGASSSSHGASAFELAARWITACDPINRSAQASDQTLRSKVAISESPSASLSTRRSAYRPASAARNFEPRFPAAPVTTIVFMSDQFLYGAPWVFEGRAGRLSTWG